MVYSLYKAALATTLVLSAFSASNAESLEIGFPADSNEGNTFLLVTSPTFFYQIDIGVKDPVDGVSYAVDFSSSKGAAFIGELHDLSLSEKPRLKGYRVCDERMMTQNTLIHGQFRIEGGFRGPTFNESSITLNSQNSTKPLCYTRKGGIVGELETELNVTLSDEIAPIETQTLEILGEFRIDSSLWVSTGVSGVLAAIVVLRCSMDCLQNGCTRQYPEWDEETRIAKLDY